MITFKLSNEGKSVIKFIDGEQVASMLLNDKEYQEWLKEGNTTEPEFTNEELLEKEQLEFRNIRNELLSNVVDHYQKPLVWETLSIEQQDKVRVYRQALLDSTANWILPEELVL